MIYTRINEVMQEKGLSVGEVARRGKIAEKAVRTLMQYPTCTYKVETLDRLSKALGIPAQELITSVPDADDTRVSTLSEAMSLPPDPQESK